jgi:hypothetical protein
MTVMKAALSAISLVFIIGEGEEMKAADDISKHRVIGVVMKAYLSVMHQYERNDGERKRLSSASSGWPRKKAHHASLSAVNT